MTLLHHFNMNEGSGSTIDGGNGATFSLVNASWESGPNGFGTALSFNGNGRANGLLPLPSNMTEFTVAAFFYVDNVGATVDKRILSKAYNETTDGHLFMLSTLHSQFRGRLKLGSDPAAGTVEVLGGTLQSGTWHHGAMTYDGSEVRLYLDGQVVAVQPSSGNVYEDNSMDTCIGNQATNHNRAFEGDVDEVRIYDHALTQQEIQNLAINDNALSGSQTFTINIDPSGPLPSGFLDASNLVYIGGFKLPMGNYGISNFTYAGGKICYNPNNDSLFISGHTHQQAVAEVNIPALVNDPNNQNSMNTATVLQNFADIRGRVSSPTLVDNLQIGGLQVIDGQLHGTIYEFYDGDGNGRESHFVFDGLDLQGNVNGLYEVSPVRGGFNGGWISKIPSEWQPLLGNKELYCGQAAISISGRTSNGPCAIGYNPADLSFSAPAPGIDYLSYPLSNSLATGTNSVYNSASNIVGSVMFPNTNTIMFFGNHGFGELCYGQGGAGGECNDPVFSWKGYHAYPYSLQIWGYDLNDFIDSMNGIVNPYDLNPYFVTAWDVPYENAAASIGGVDYDAASNRLFVMQPHSLGPKVLVFSVA